MTTPTNGNGKILEKVKLLLNLSRDKGATEAEALSALEKAQQLLFKYNLEMADVEKFELPSQEAEKMVEEWVSLDAGNFNNQPKEWKIRLASAVARNNFCEILVATCSVIFLGKKLDIEVCKELYAFIVSQAEALATEATVAYKRSNPYLREHPMRFKNNFLHGLVVRVTQRLKERLAEMTNATEKSTELVAFSKEALRCFVKQQHPHTSSRRGAGPAGRAGFLEGLTAGDNISFKPTKQPQRLASKGALQGGR